MDDPYIGFLFMRWHFANEEYFNHWFVLKLEHVMVSYWWSNHLLTLVLSSHAEIFKIDELNLICLVHYQVWRMLSFFINSRCWFTPFKKLVFVKLFKLLMLCFTSDFIFSLSVHPMYLNIRSMEVIFSSHNQLQSLIFLPNGYFKLYLTIYNFLLWYAFYWHLESDFSKTNCMFTQVIYSNFFLK